MKIPTNVEMIAQDDMEGKLLIPIPTTKFCVLGEKIKETKWKVSIISKIGRTKEIIDKNMDEGTFIVLMQKTLAFRDTQHFKENHIITKKFITTHFKSIIKENQAVA